jgi:hypothetical protein
MIKPKDRIGHWFRNDGAYHPIHAYVVKYLGMDANIHLFDAIEFDEDNHDVVLRHEITGADGWVPYKPGNTDLQEAVMAVFE